MRNEKPDNPKAITKYGLFYSLLHLIWLLISEIKCRFSKLQAIGVYLQGIKSYTFDDTIHHIIQWNHNEASMLRNALRVTESKSFSVLPFHFSS